MIEKRNCSVPYFTQTDRAENRQIRVLTVQAVEIYSKKNILYSHKGEEVFSMKKVNDVIGKSANAVKKELMHANRKVVTIGTVLVSTLVMSIMPAFAAGEGLFENLGSAFGNLTTALTLLAPAVALAAYVAAKIWQMLVPEKQGRAEPREWARSALVSYALIVFASAIINFIGNIASGN